MIGDITLGGPFVEVTRLRSSRALPWSRSLITQLASRSPRVLMNSHRIPHSRRIVSSRRSSQMDINLLYVFKLK